MSREITETYLTPEEAKAIRLSLGWTLEHEAKMLGVKGGRSNMALFERGERRFTFAMAELLKAYADGYVPKDKPAKLLKRVLTEIDNREQRAIEAAAAAIKEHWGQPYIHIAEAAIAAYTAARTV